MNAVTGVFDNGIRVSRSKRNNYIFNSKLLIQDKG